MSGSRRQLHAGLPQPHEGCAVLPAGEAFVALPPASPPTPLSPWGGSQPLNNKDLKAMAHGAVVPSCAVAAIHCDTAVALAIRPTATILKTAS